MVRTLLVPLLLVPGLLFGQYNRPGSTDAQFLKIGVSPRATALADAYIAVSAHKGQGLILTECIDPSVIDENDPLESGIDIIAQPPGKQEADAPSPQRLITRRGRLRRSFGDRTKHLQRSGSSRSVFIFSARCTFRPRAFTATAGRSVAPWPI